MIFERLTDVEQIKEVLLSPDILTTTGLDNVEPYIDVDSVCYLGCFVDDELIGVAAFEPDNSVCVNYHPNLLKVHRGSNSIPFTKGALKWLVENAPMYKKVNAKFPACYNWLNKYSEDCGFTFEGVDRGSCKLGDRVCYGITKQEIKEHEHN